MYEIVCLTIKTLCIEYSTYENIHDYHYDEFHCSEFHFSDYTYISIMFSTFVINFSFFSFFFDSSKIHMHAAHNCVENKEN